MWEINSKNVKVLVGGRWEDSLNVVHWLIVLHILFKKKGKLLCVYIFYHWQVLLCMFKCVNKDIIMGWCRAQILWPPPSPHLDYPELCDPLTPWSHIHIYMYPHVCAYLIILYILTCKHTIIKCVMSKYETFNKQLYVKDIAPENTTKMEFVTSPSEEDRILWPPIFAIPCW